MTEEAVQGSKLLARASLNGHISKEIWVAQAIADEDLFVDSLEIKASK